MRPIIAGFAAGLLFGLGLAVSGMIDPRVVIGFLDPAGAWNPALMLVMVGALAVALPGYRLTFRQPSPLWAESFAKPAVTALDRWLVLGSALFGIGWGLAGYCPGPAIAALSALWPGTLVFVATTLIGLALAKHLRSRAGR